VVLLLGLVWTRIGPGAREVRHARWVKQAPVPTWHDLHGVDMISATEGWAVGGNPVGGGSSILHTTDAGATWKRQPGGRPTAA
jgi:photosystem II stability/assembly factor-like uncharacterized protein